MTDPSAHEILILLTELKGVVSHYSVTQTRLADDMQAMAQRMLLFSETSVTFTEYRKTLHERFGKIHQQIGDIDLTIEQIDARLKNLELFVLSMRTYWKLMLGIGYVMMAVITALIAKYGTALFLSIWHF